MFTCQTGGSEAANRWRSVDFRAEIEGRSTSRWAAEPCANQVYGKRRSFYGIKGTVGRVTGIKVNMWGIFR